jgi:hypothetical protein
MGLSANQNVRISSDRRNQSLAQPKTFNLVKRPQMHQAQSALNANLKLTPSAKQSTK